MGTLADKIEKYLKILIEKSDNGIVEIQRAEIAETFSCVPSQVNYVLRTRFAEESGYEIETKRGGGGYIKIKKTPNINKEEMLKYAKKSKIQSSKSVEELIEQLYQGGLLTDRERLLMKNIMKEVGKVRLSQHEYVMTKILNGIIITVLEKDMEEEQR